MLIFPQITLTRNVNIGNFGSIVVFSHSGILAFKGKFGKCNDNKQIQGTRCLKNQISPEMFIRGY